MPQLTPWDEHNQALVHAVHPPHWVNPTPAPRYDLVVIGAGTAGLVCAAGAAGLGAKVALIERHFMGGDCLNYGCVPSKTLLHEARKPGADFATAMARVRQVRAQIAPHDSAERFAKLGVDVFFGEGSFAGRDRVSVGNANLRFKRAVIATGTHATVPAIPGLNEVAFLTHESVFSLTALPPRLAILGGGPIGAEMAQAFSALGSAVTLVEHGAEILGNDDPEAAAVLRCALESEGVIVLRNTEATQFTTTGSETSIQLRSGTASSQIVVDAVLVAAGRTPNVANLALDKAGVQQNVHGIVIDDFFRTANARIFGCGDVCMRFRFTHAADFAARAVIQNALFFGRKRLSALHIPWCTYTAPELAHVGLTAAEATKRAIALDTYTVPMSGVDRAICDEVTGGFFRVHVRKGTDVIVGATMVSAHAGESIFAVVLALNNRIGLGKIAAAIAPYPTQSEAIRRAGDLYSRTRLTPRAARFLRAMIGLNR